MIHRCINSHIEQYQSCGGRAYSYIARFFFSFNRNYPRNHTRKNRKHSKKLDGEQEGDKPVYPDVNQRPRRAAVGQEHRHRRGDRHLCRVWSHHVIRLYQRR